MTANLAVDGTKEFEANEKNIFGTLGT